MTYWRRLLVAGVGALGLVGASTAVAGADQGGDTLVQFDTMAPVTGSAVGTLNDRGIRGGGLPWVITSGQGDVTRDGNVEVEVTGLVIPVPPLNGTNPVAFFKATVSCITPSGVVNVSTANFPADKAGNSVIVDHVTLPSVCNNPIVFVAAPSGAWFSMSTGDDGNQ